MQIIKDNHEAKNDVVARLKAAKNKTEQNGMRACNIRDCAAIMRYFAFLEEELRKPDHGLDEYKGAMKVGDLRKEVDLFQGLSFDAISSIGSNGAVIHYKPEADTAKAMNNDEIYLLDSGGQYLDGTTDITRCGHFGGKAPTAF
jgi:Xaa-Pro aminopeptidase